MFDAGTTCLVVVGAQWGDEGKGKLVDVLAERADVVVRYQGGANAGHTVVIGDSQFILRQIPSGILHPGVVCVVGNGVVLEPETFFAELDQLAQRQIDTRGRIFVSDRAHLVLPYHKLLDAASEKSQKLGTTGRGIGPAYEDKYGRRGIRLTDLAEQNGMTSADELLKAVEQQGVTAEQARDQVETQVLVEQLVADENGPIEPTDKELRELYAQVKKQQAQAGGSGQGGAQDIPPFAQVRDQLAEQATNQEIGKVATALVEDLRADADITINL